MTVFTRQIQTAQRMIAKNGRKCVWRELGDGVTVDSANPWDVTRPTVPNHVSHDVSVVFLPHSSAGLSFLRSLSDDPINVGDDYGLMHAVDFVPTMRASIYDKLDTTLLRRIKSISVLQPDGEPILYTVSFMVA